MERKDYLEETDFEDVRPLTRGNLVRMCDVIRADAKLEERRMAWDHDETSVQARALAEAKADLMSSIISALKGE